MNNVLSFPIAKRAIPMENNEKPAVFGKRLIPPGTIKHYFNADGVRTDLKPGEMAGNHLLLHNRGRKGLSFTGEFYLKGQGVSTLPVVAVGQCPGEVYTKLARLPQLAKFKDAILGTPITALDWAM